MLHHKLRTLESVILESLSRLLVFAVQATTATTFSWQPLDECLDCKQFWCTHRLAEMSLKTENKPSIHICKFFTLIFTSSNQKNSRTYAWYHWIIPQSFQSLAWGSHGTLSLNTRRETKNNDIQETRSNESAESGFRLPTNTLSRQRASCLIEFPQSYCILVFKDGKRGNLFQVQQMSKIERRNR